MADRHDTELTPPEAATPLQPTGGAVVGGDAITFAWAPAGEARSYRLEVATDTDFDTVVYAETVEGTEHTVGGLTGDGQQTFYWRVITETAAGESHGEVIESFISPPFGEVPAATEHPAATPAPAYAEGTPERPRQEEDLGPGAEMVKAVAAGATAEVTGSAEAYAEEAAQGVQHEGIGVAQILGFVFACIVVIGMAIVFIMQITFLEAGRAEIEIANVLDYPELRQVQAQAAARLNDYGVIDANAGVYQIPLEQAQRRLVEQAEAAERNPATYSPELRFLVPPQRDP